MNYFRAIDSLRKGCAYTAMSDNYEDIIWQDENTTIPTKKECEDELVRLEAEDLKIQYQKDRLKEYPSIQDCIHAILDGGKTLEDLQKIRADIKEKYPKPT